MAILLSICLIFGNNHAAAVHLPVQQDGVGNEIPSWPKFLKTPQSTIQFPQSTSRFPFDFVLFQHLPKTGGSTMRFALRQLSRSRGQTTQICYDDLRCTNKVQQKFLEKIEGVVTFNPVWLQHQIVTGHGLRRGFEEVWHLNNVAWIAVLREPLYLLLSLWNQEFRAKESVYFNMSLDRWIEVGRSENMADFYTSYFLKIAKLPNVLDQSNTNFFQAFAPAKEIQISQNNSVWRAALIAAMQAPNVVLMDQADWQQSMNRLAPILNLTKLEAGVFLKLLQDEHKNRAPQNYTEIIHIKKNNYERVVKSLGLLSFLYSNQLGKTATNSINVLAKNQERVVLQITFDNDDDVDLPTLSGFS